MSNLGLNCLHTAKTAIKGVQVRNVLILDYDIESSDPAYTGSEVMHGNPVGLQANISSSSTPLLKEYELQWLWRDFI